MIQTSGVVTNLSVSGFVRLCQDVRWRLDVHGYMQSFMCSYSRMSVSERLCGVLCDLVNGLSWRFACIRF